MTFLPLFLDMKSIFSVIKHSQISSHSPSMAAVNSVSFSTLSRCSDQRLPVPSARSLASDFDVRVTFLFQRFSVCHHLRVRTSNFSSRLVIRCMFAGTDATTVAETKSNFLQAYKRPIPSIYNTVLQELIVQQHLMRYKRTYCYDPAFSFGFVTVYDQIMEGYPVPSDEDQDAIIQAYIKELNEDPKQYREKKKRKKRAESQTANEAITKCLGEFNMLTGFSELMTSKGERCLI